MLESVNKNFLSWAWHLGA